MLCNIHFKIEVFMNLVSLFTVYKLRIGNKLADFLPVQNYLQQGDA